MSQTLLLLYKIIFEFKFSKSKKSNFFELLFFSVLSFDLKSSEITLNVEVSACLNFSFKFFLYRYYSFKFEYLQETLVILHQNIFDNIQQLYFFQFHHIYLKK